MIEQQIMSNKANHISEDINVPEGEHEEGSKEASWSTQFIIIYLYLIQGIPSSIIYVMPFIYPTLPDYDVLAIFAAANIPFSLKFVIAPFLERVTSLDYGKRKVWIVISLIASGMLLLITSYHTHQQQAKILALLLFWVQICMVILSISADTLAIKELKKADKAGSIQGYTYSFGMQMCNLLLLKLTNSEFAQSIGLSQPITTPDVLIRYLVVFMLAPAVYMHTCFKETTLHSEYKGTQLEFCQTIAHFSIFLKPSTRYFRTALYFITCSIGFNFFAAGLQFQIVSEGFSRNDLNTINYIISLPMIIMTLYFMASWTKLFQKFHNAILFSSFALLAFQLIFLIILPLNTYVYAVFTFTNTLLTAWRRIITSVMSYTFPMNALQGMYLTVLTSGINFGRLPAFQTKMIGIFGYKPAAFAGLGIQLALNIILFWYLPWMDQGTLEIDEKIRDIQDENEFQLQIDE